ncbi:hypothetical protein [Nonomuraea typhae]|uniref:Uncharacterized protein n=1 Tax=Nonomuraea typhae TaxID=2603600 RepID=A0ABW7YS39_9ACTN
MRYRTVEPCSTTPSQPRSRSQRTHRFTAERDSPVRSTIPAIVGREHMDAQSACQAMSWATRTRFR